MKTMKTIAIFGAGQAGVALSKMLGAKYRLLCFADNLKNKQGNLLDNIPVISPIEAVQLNPDYFCLGVLDDERTAEMENQLRNLNYQGQIIRADILKFLDLRLAMLRLFFEQINQVNGAVAELGVYQGDLARQLNLLFPKRTLHLFDTFFGFTESDVAIEKKQNFSRANTGDFNETNPTMVLAKMAYPEKVFIYPGKFPETFKDCQIKQFAFVSLDVDLYYPTKQGLILFWQKLADNGAILIHDYNSQQFRGVKKAVDEFLLEKELNGDADFIKIPVCDIHGSLFLLKTGSSIRREL